jgi:serine/threonine-protein kinase HipA
MSIDVYLHGKQIAGLFPVGEDGYRFVYRPETVEEMDAGKAQVSSSLPVRSSPFDPDASRAYIEGLLPQGTRRRAIARELGIDPSDGYGLIGALGRDCLGAVTFLPEGEAAEPRRDGAISWLTEAELEEVVQPRPSRLLDPARPQRMRFALPGERHKLALVYDEGKGRWGWPDHDVPSTHIIKPEAAERPGLVANEHACSLAYRELGLPVAHTSVETIAGRTCLVSKRFDRWGDGPNADRLHQESFTQAIGVTPDSAAGRLATGTPSLREASGLLREIGEERAVETLMRVTFADLLIGCTELRGANAALLYGDNGPMLAPFYDIASSEIYGETRPRPTVIGPDVPPAPLLIDIRHTIELCGLEFQPALIDSVKLMGPLCVALGTFAERAQGEGWYRRAIDEAVQVATARTLGFREESVYLRPPGGESPR